MGRRTEFLISGGFDYFPDSRLSGHDTSYSPDGDDVNQREDYNYQDADEIINQPGFELRLMAGIQYLFGR